ncbi:MAG: RecX family transcriptional regulator [Clostridia bacterium]|nr:RecX family transcriptional regulator [Clostridia bacterium]
MNEITQITPQIKDKRRCNVYVDGRFCCGLTLEATVKNRLKVGQIIEPERLAQIQLESEKNTAFDKALTHISATQKTEKQVREFLKGKGYLPVVADYVVEKLRSYNFLNDEEYAQQYLESASKRKGKKLIRMELRAKGVSDRDIDGAFDGVDDEKERQAARGLLEKYLKGKTLDMSTKQKAYRYLLGKGFDYEIIKSELACFGDDDDPFYNE